MEYVVTWSPQASEDVIECAKFIKKVSKEAAIKFVKQIYEMTDGLKDFPERNPVFKTPKTIAAVFRKFVFNKRYILVYLINENNIYIYRVLDARRNFGSLLWRIFLFKVSTIEIIVVS